MVCMPTSDEQMQGGPLSHSLHICLADYDQCLICCQPSRHIKHEDMVIPSAWLVRRSTCWEVHKTLQYWISEDLESEGL